MACRIDSSREEKSIFLYFSSKKYLELRFISSKSKSDLLQEIQEFFHRFHQVIQESSSPSQRHQET